MSTSTLHIRSIRKIKGTDIIFRSCFVALAFKTDDMCWLCSVSVCTCLYRSADSLRIIHAMYKGYIPACIVCLKLNITQCLQVGSPLVKKPIGFLRIHFLNLWVYMYSYLAYCGLKKRVCLSV